MTVPGLPDEVLDLILNASISEFATVSSAGVPIDTPTSYFPADDLSKIGVTTGLAYPIKADRARRNPKVGMLIEGRRNQPVVSIAGRAAVRDADIQDNALRYIAESSSSMPSNPPWSLASKALWYWSRIWIDIAPVRVLWWDSPQAMDEAPKRWDAPVPEAWPVSDPAPPGAAGETPKWPQPSWPDQAREILAQKAEGHLTLVDDEGYPLPIRARSARQTPEGFELDIPAGAPWRPAGKASLCFQGRATFLGELSDGVLKVERALPVLPLMKNLKELWEPTPETYAGMMARLTAELERRGQPMPVIPEVQPAPTAGALRRLASDLIPPAQAKTAQARTAET